MNKDLVFNKMHGFLHEATVVLSGWLDERLPRLSENWWDDCVLCYLNEWQQQFVAENSISQLSKLDLAALLKVAKTNWYGLTRLFSDVTPYGKTCIDSMIPVRNHWAHMSGEIPSDSSVNDDCEKVKAFFSFFSPNDNPNDEIKAFQKQLSSPEVKHKAIGKTERQNAEIKKADIVCLVSNPEEKGVVIDVSELAGQKKYTVFMNNEAKLFFEGQIQIAGQSSGYNTVSLDELCSNLTAYQLRVPATSNLYSLNSAKIDFVPYQFKPALKIIQSDSPRLLIADSVGVGKTIEAGLIIKELEARGNIDNILIVCPKALVSERKWELEMQRFGEEFVPVQNGAELKNILKKVDKTGEWPLLYSRSIIPYSLLNKTIIDGTPSGRGKRNQFSFRDLETPPHFDILIVDEAHHLRHRNTDAYAAVKYLTENSDTVLFLTATPIMMEDEDLFTLLNLLRPDIIIDKNSFSMISQPNKYINEAISAARSNKNNWKKTVSECLDAVSRLEWGAEVTVNKPEFSQVKEILAKNKVIREDRVLLVNKLENLNTFSTMINRTRRKDIQDFCVRRTSPIRVRFTKEQKKLFNNILSFEAKALSILHGDVKSVSFMMSTLNRQAASCIFGLGGFIDDLVHKRMDQMLEMGFDEDYPDDVSWLETISSELKAQIRNLPEEDPKLDVLVQEIEKKQLQENNKVIIFSSFIHTLKYLKKKLDSKGYRVEMVCGSVKDSDRFVLRERFSKEKHVDDAIDILLFTEVGSEGLDYQFCDMMINYDLPWNPMKIEQRIGRIDRRGQMSEAVSIINLLTEETVDFQIYDRCLSRIGVFEESIGDCDDILGDITKQIQDIVLNPKLTEEERNLKLERIADNEVKLRIERQALEEQQKQLFGFDLQNYAEEIEQAENPWLTQEGLLSMLDTYLQERLGEGTYILKKAESAKSLRLNVENRMILLADYEKLPAQPRNPLYREWSKFLRSNVSYLPFTFSGEVAQADHSLVHISVGHPFVKQAAAYFNTTKEMTISLSVSGGYQPGKYPFAIYSWDYKGYRPERRLITVCENQSIADELFQIIKAGSESEIDFSEFIESWESLETKFYDLWKKEKEKYIKNAELTAATKKASLYSSLEAKRNLLEQQISNSTDANILRMYESAKQKAEREYERKVDEIESVLKTVDIMPSLVVRGVVEVLGE